MEGDIGTHCRGKTQGKWQQQKKSVRKNTGNLEILPKHREFCLPDSLILKGKNVSIFAAKIYLKNLKLDRSAKSVLCM